MQPFLKLKKDASASMPIDTMTRKSDEDESQDLDGLEIAMEELHNALMAKDYKSAAQIFRDAADLVDSQPHVEGEHIDE